MKPRLRLSKHLIFHLLLWASFCFFFGCSGNTEIGNPEASSGLIALSDDAEVTTYLRSQLRVDIAEPVPPPYSGGDSDGGAGAPTMESPPDSDFFPRKNTVLVSGDIIYAADGDQVLVLRAAQSGEPEMLSSIYTGGTLTALHRIGNRLMAVQQIESRTDAAVPALISENRTGIRVIDISDPARPRTHRDIRMEGEATLTLVRNGRLVLAQHFRPEWPAFETDGVSTEQVEESLDRLENATLSELLPDYAVLDPDGILREEGPLLAPGNIYRPEWTAGGAMTIVTTVEPSVTDVALSSVALVGNMDTVQETGASLYLTLSRACDGSVPCTEGNPVQTFLYSVDIERDDPVFTTSGEVWGTVEGDSVLEEENGILRGISSVRQGNPSDGDVTYAARLFLLEQQEGRLETLAETDIGSYFARPSVLFTDSHAYVFSGDRLMPVDISDPASPRRGTPLMLDSMLKDLSILREDTLIGTGAARSPTDGEIQLQIFRISISDPDGPRLADQDLMRPGIGTGSFMNIGSPAVQSETGLIAAPLSVFGTFQSNLFTGASIWQVTETEIAFLEEIAVPGVVFTPDSFGLTVHFIKNRIWLFHPGGVSHADPDNPESAAETLWFTGT